MLQNWKQIWKDQGLNEDETGDIDPTLTAEQAEAQANAIMDDLERNCEIVWVENEYGMQEPRIVRKAQ